MSRSLLSPVRRLVTKTTILSRWRSDNNHQECSSHHSHNAASGGPVSSGWQHGGMDDGEGYVRIDSVLAGALPRMRTLAATRWVTILPFQQQAAADWHQSHRRPLGGYICSGSQ